MSPALRELDAAAKAAGITVMNEVGVDPGVDYLFAIKTITDVHKKGGTSSIRTAEAFLRPKPRTILSGSRYSLVAAPSTPFNYQGR